MNKMKIGAEIKTEQDLKDLVMSLINGTSEFTQAFITKLTTNYSEGSKLIAIKSRINTVVERVIYEMCINGEIECVDGVFYHINKVKSI